MTTEFAFSVLNTPMSPAWPHRSLNVEGLALPKSFKSDRLSFGNAVIRWMSVQTNFDGTQMITAISGTAIRSLFQENENA